MSFGGIYVTQGSVKTHKVWCDI